MGPLPINRTPRSEVSQSLVYHCGTSHKCSSSKNATGRAVAYQSGLWDQGAQNKLEMRPPDRNNGEMIKSSPTVLAALLGLAHISCQSPSPRPPSYGRPLGPHPWPPPTSAAASTPTDVAHRILGALISGDPEPYVRLLMSYDDLKRYCPGVARVSPQSYATQLHVSRTNFQKCRALVDWTGARIEGLRGARLSRGPTACIARVQGGTHLKFMVRLRNGKAVEVKFGDPLLLDGRRWTQIAYDRGFVCRRRGW